METTVKFYRKKPRMHVSQSAALFRFSLEFQLLRKHCRVGEENKKVFCFYVASELVSKATTNFQGLIDTKQKWNCTAG